MSAPTQPTEQQILDHRVAHLPPRAWCRHCVRGRGKALFHHFSPQKAVHEVPVVVIDYMFLGERETAENLAILAVKQHQLKYPFAHVVPCKGSSHRYPVQALLADLRTLGHS